MNAHHKRRTPPSVAPLARPSWAPNLLTVYIGEGSLDRLMEERTEAKHFGVWRPIVALPLGTDPMSFRWPTRGRNVRILGQVDRATLLDLMHSLARDGACAIAGLDASGVLHLQRMEMAIDQDNRIHGG